MSNFKETIQDIKSRISCVEYAQRNNLSIRYSGDRTVSPFRSGAKNKTSFWVFDDHWYDWGGGNGGDVIDLAAMLNHNGDKSQAIRELAQLTGVTLSSDTDNTEWVNYTQNLCQEIQYYHEQLTDDDRQYIHNRGITDETINRVKLGRTNNGRLSFPYWKNGYICYYASRYLPGGAYPDRKYMKMPIDDYNEHTVWGLHTIENNTNRDILVIAEGAFDALSFEQEGYSVISAITGRFSGSQLPTVLSLAKMFKKVFLVYDNDLVTKAGENFTLDMTKILTQNRISCLVGTVPDPHKDVSEYYAYGNKLNYLIDNAKDGTTFLADKITDPTEFETFARSVCRYLSAPQVDVFFTKLNNDNFSANFLKTLAKECKKAPPDDLIAKEIISQHKLLYHPRISFFEYNGKCWDMKEDKEIENYISKALAIYATGSRIASILRIIQSLTVTNKLFNMNPVVNFINGTLELTETEPYYNFREHSDADLCTYCLDYPYMPDAVSNEWLEFIDTVTDNDGRRASFLQEFAGYVLQNDSNLHRAAVLVGSGANGKSVYFNTLTNVFGFSNVQHIEASDLADKFQLINLQSAMLNISEEVKNDITNSEAMIKKIVSGDTVTACYKQKPFINFKPRTKLILSLNNFPKFSDKSDGITRRLSFVEFPLKFVEVPKEPNERPINRTLESTFAEISHLSGIFNWVLDGYIMVRRCGYLTETYEHQTVLDEFKEDSDPTITFVRQLEITQRVSYSALYDMYKYWCEDNGYRPEPSRSALRSIGKHIKSFRKDIKSGVSSNVRWYEPC